jgi:ribosomal protein S12 methylthiotransferase
MKRPASSENNLARIRRWREICPDLAIRSTFIVGFPGETDEEFEQLLEFIEDAKLDRVGCFTYSAVDGATANALPGHVPEAIKEERKARFMATQELVSSARLQRKIGRTLTVLIDTAGGDGAVGRSSADAPEIDGVVHVAAHPKLTAGEFAQVKITSAEAHDLRGVVT